MSTKRQPKNLLEAVRYFADLDVATDFVAKLRWPNGPVCPKCGSADKHSYLTTRRIWKCKACKKQFSVKVGTIFEDSALGLDKWLPAVWLIANSKNGISSHELGRALGTTQKSAWFMLHRIRLAMRSGSFEMMNGTVEVDETYIGGKARNMHKGERRAKIGRAARRATRFPLSASSSAAARCAHRSWTTSSAPLSKATCAMLSHPARTSIPMRWSRTPDLNGTTTT
jgi:transposase-like protein